MGHTPQLLRLLRVIPYPFLVGLAACAGDSPKPPTDTVTTAGVVQTEEGKIQPASDEVQERAVIRDNRTKQGTLMPLQPTPGVASPPTPPVKQAYAYTNPPAFGSLPGEFSIRTSLKNAPLTARDGGHHSVDAVITVESVIGPNQKFKLASVQPDFTTIQASGGYYMSAAGAIGGDYDDTQTLQTELRTPDRDIALFRIDGPN